MKVVAMKYYMAVALTLAVTLARDPDASRAPRLEVFTPELVVRESTAAPARALRR